MRYLNAALLFILFTSGCIEEKRKEQKIAFDSFIFSFDGHSMKFTQRDTVFMRQRGSLSNELLYTIISKQAQVTINHFVDSINSTTYDTTYIQQHLQDGSEFKFYLIKNRATKSIFIYGDKGPINLYLFADWLVRWKEKQRFRPINAKIYFGNLHHVLLPTIPPPRP